MTTPGRTIAWTSLVLALSLAVVPGLARSEPIATIPVGVVPFAIHAADLDGDGRSEILAGGLDRDAIVAVAPDALGVLLNQVVVGSSSPDGYPYDDRARASVVTGFGLAYLPLVMTGGAFSENALNLR